MENYGTRQKFNTIKCFTCDGQDPDCVSCNGKGVIHVAGDHGVYDE